MRPGQTVLVCILLSPLAAAPGAAAQQLPKFAAGDTLRVHAPGVALKRARVTFTAWGDSVLALHTARGDTTLAVPFADVLRLDRYAGKNRFKGALKGIGIFGTVGAFVGGLIGRNAVSGCREFLCELDALSYMAGGMLIGALVGAPVGAAALAPDRWHRVELPVALGFPAYRKPLHETFAFRLLWLGGSILLAAAIS